MAGTGNVVVKNTFISVIADDDLADMEAVRPRLNTEPVYIQQSSFVGNSLRPSFESEEKVLNSLPSTFVGDLESEVVPCGSGESSSVGSLFRKLSALSLFQLNRRRRDYEVPSQQNVLQLEPEAQKHVDNHGVGIPAEWKGKTSVMVRNVSYRCTREMFREELHKAGFADLFDYIYVPVNSKRGTSKGYAFLNFADSASAYRFKECFDGRKMNVPGGVKPLEVIPANKQGYTENFSHYMDKRSKISTTSTPSPIEQKRECEQSIISDENKKLTEKTVHATHTDRSPTMSMSMCHSCQNHVPSKNRFCHFCGAVLHICAGASRSTYSISNGLSTIAA
eukprot:TRINITY_DN19545_c0_g2_i1.p1 TRINITY_DN19545_c0_g2~~TRINITY_DN19545_c0_g2_i1.p1  ORF type:complete len:336 (+),score=44.99 TRINITY_DN19545_c0_g2_i1:46-1053(+)